jgi:hypothetical protein
MTPLVATIGRLRRMRDVRADLRGAKESAMILLTDEVRAWGHTATMHYTHPPRSVVMQVSLSARADFTETAPGDPMFRGVVFFSGFMAGGVETDLMAAPLFGAAQFRADNLTEVRGELIAENCGVRATVTQFNRLAAAASSDSVDAAVQSRTVSFLNPTNGAIKYKHIVKMFAGGRAVSEQEAVDTARSNAGRFFLDLTALEMKITADDDNAALAQRIDTTSGTFASSPL